MTPAVGTYYVPFECIFEENAHGEKGLGTVKALFLRIGLPVCFGFLIAIAGCFVIWLRHVCRNCCSCEDQSDFVPKRTFVPIALFATLAFSYGDLSLELMKALNCIRVDRTQSDPPNVYDLYALEKVSVWVEDPILYCSEGDHKLVKNVGIVGLILLHILMGFLLLWIIITLKKIGNRNTAPEGDDRREISELGIAFLFREFLSTLRKGLVAAAVIFAARRGTNLQAALSLGILIIVLAVHWVFGPFILRNSEEYEQDPGMQNNEGCLLSMAKWGRSCRGLQALETASLLTSISVFHSAILFGDPETTETLKTILELGVLTLNALFMLFVLFILFIFFVSRRSQH